MNRRGPVRSAALILAIPLLACNVLTRASPTPAEGADATAAPTPPPTTAPVIESFDGSENSWAALHAALESDPEAVAAQASAAMASPDPDKRFPAVYVLGLIVDEPTAGLLLPALDDPEPALRAIAAGSLIGLGEPASLPVLIEATASDEVLPFSHPPRPIWMFADDALRSYTGVDFGLDPSSEDLHRATAEAWQAWWAANGPSLTWDGSMWVAP